MSREGDCSDLILKASQQNFDINILLFPEKFLRNSPFIFSCLISMSNYERNTIGNRWTCSSTCCPAWKRPTVLSVSRLLTPSSPPPTVSGVDKIASFHNYASLCSKFTDQLVRPLFGADLNADLRRNRRSVAFVIDTCTAFLYQNSLEEEVNYSDNLMSRFWLITG